MKKHKKILKELKRRRKFNNNYCYNNNCSTTPYMDGSNMIIDQMMIYIKKL